MTFCFCLRCENDIVSKRERENPPLLEWSANYGLWATCFCTAHKLRMVFTFLSGWKKIKRRMFYDVKMIGNSNFSVHKVKFYWNPAKGDVLPAATLVLQRQSGASVTGGCVTHKA